MAPLVAGAAGRAPLYPQGENLCLIFINRSILTTLTPYGLTVTVKPPTTAGMAAAQATARRVVEAIERQARERAEAGLALDGVPDLSTEGERDGFYHVQLIRELAIRHITSWIGVELGRGPAPPTPENVAAVMELYPVGECFFQQFTLRQVLLNAAKRLYGRLPLCKGLL